MAVNDFLITVNFRLSEFASRDTGEVKIHSELVRKTQRIRDLVGLPVRVNSGYRTPEHNRKVGGAANSLHCEGKAVDLSCAFVSLAQLTIAAIWAGFPKVIVYTKYDFIHCDLSEVRQYIVPTDWVPWLYVIFPEYSSCIKPWSDVKDLGRLEL